MKIRTGFVSNSSSSSFIVRLPEKNTAYLKPEKTAIFEDIVKLLEFGFRPVPYRYPSALEMLGNFNYDAPKEIPEETRSLGYSVSCNQDDVIEFLVGNDIPFMAACHYGHETVCYQRGADSVLYLRNPGLEWETYGSSMEAYILSGDFVRREPKVPPTGA